MLRVRPKRAKKGDRKRPATDRDGHRGIEAGGDRISPPLLGRIGRHERDERTAAELRFRAEVSAQHREGMVPLGHDDNDVVAQKLRGRR